MNSEFKNLYDAWRSATMFKSTGQFQDSTWKNLMDWCRANRGEAFKSIKEILLEGPGWIVQALDELSPGMIKADGYIPLDTYCNLWLIILNGGENIDYYEDWKAWQKWLENNYKPWNPFKEDDPNPSLEEWKEEYKK